MMHHYRGKGSNFFYHILPQCYTSCDCSTQFASEHLKFNQYQVVLRTVQPLLGDFSLVENCPDCPDFFFFVCFLNCRHWSSISMSSRMANTNVLLSYVTWAALSPEKTVVR